MHSISKRTTDKQIRIQISNSKLIGIQIEISKFEIRIIVMTPQSKDHQSAAIIEINTLITLWRMYVHGMSLEF